MLSIRIPVAEDRAPAWPAESAPLFQKGERRLARLEQVFRQASELRALGKRSSKVSTASTDSTCSGDSRDAWDDA